MCKAIGTVIAIFALSTVLLAIVRPIYVYVTAETGQETHTPGVDDSVKDIKTELSRMLKNSPFEANFAR
jgi:hypothetical protein